MKISISVEQFDLDMATAAVNALILGAPKGRAVQSVGLYEYGDHVTSKIDLEPLPAEPANDAAPEKAGA